MPFQARSVPPEGASLPRASRRTSEWLAASGAAVLSVLLYASTLDNPFVYDDFRLIVENPAIQTKVVVHERRSEEHTSELQSQSNLVCRLLLEKKKKKKKTKTNNKKLTINNH